MNIPVVTIKWTPIRKWWATYLWRRRRRAWDEHCFDFETSRNRCDRCEWYTENDGRQTTPCPVGRKLIDALYPKKADERAAYYAKAEALK